MDKFIITLLLSISIFFISDINNASAAGTGTKNDPYAPDVTLVNNLIRQAENIYEVTFERNGAWYKHYYGTDGNITFSLDKDTKELFRDVSNYTYIKYIKFDSTSINTGTTRMGIVANDVTGFFTLALPALLVDAPVETIPTAMTKTLVDGGVLSTALIVLAILLGVSLIRRFPLWRLR